MHTHKRILSGLLVLCMILALCPVIPFTAKAAAPVPIQFPTIGKNGSLAGMDPDGTGITYLSDHFSDKLVAYNHVNGTAPKSVANGTYGGKLYAFTDADHRYQINGKTDANGVRVVNGRTFNPSIIYLGPTGIQYDKGIGVQPDHNNRERYLTFDVKGMGNRFYAVVGGTDAAITNPSTKTVYMDFEVWGSRASEYSADAEFVKLAYTTQIRSYLTAEFDVDITGYNYIKLVYKLTSGYTDASNAACAWGNACVYTVPVADTEPPTELPSNPPHSTDPRDPSYYAGKKVSILGDSISTYTNVSNNAAYNTTIGVNKGFYGDDSYGGFTRKDTWWQQTIDLLGMELLVDNAWGGACILNARPEQDNVGANSVAYGDRCVNLHNDITGEKPDVILVFKGTNDFSYFPSTLGTAEDIDYSALVFKNTDGTFSYATPTTTCEAYAIMLHKMQTAYPDAEIFCMTLMPRRGDADQPDGFNASIKAIAERFGCGVVELGNLFSSDEAEFDKYIADQKVHPNKAGMDLMTQAVVGSMLNREATVYDVSFNLKDGVLDNNAHVALGNSNYQITLTPAVVNNGLKDVKVTMGGVDITAQVYSNGTVNIPSVTGDVVISATSNPLNGKHENASNILYLSDLYNTASKVAELNNAVRLDKEYSSNLYLFLEGKRWLIAGNAATDANGNRTFTLSDGSQVTFNKTDIALGYTAVKYNKGLGVHPSAGNAASRYIVYSVGDLGVDRFYAVVGGTGSNITNPANEDYKIDFELWGSTATEYNANDFVKLASVTELRAHLTGEFDVDISGYNYIKLIVKMSDGYTANTSCPAAWADACVYSTKPAHTHAPAETVVENKVDATCGADGSYEEVVKCECGHEISRTPKVIPATGAHIYDEGVVTKEPTYTETGVKTYTCGTCGDTKTEDIPMLEKTVVDTKFTGKSLALEGAVTINLYVTYTVDGVTMNEDFVEANAGVLYWSVEDMPADRDAAILGTETHKADVKCAGVYQGNTEFFAMSHGIPAKCYGDTVYFRTYILVDGEYQYGEVEEYSILAYCENVFKNQNKPKLESALVALLNYGSAAQTYFAKTGETPVLVNAGFETYLENGWITADMLELSAADKVQTPLKGASAEMTVNFAQSGVMGGTSKSLALEGAIATNYYVAVTDHEALANAQSEKAYFWTEAKYNELQAAGIPLSKENASYVVDAQLTYSTRYGYEYFVASEQVPAPEWGNTQYMATVITDANGVDHCSGVITYSPLEYAAYLLNNGVANREDPVCEWLIAYSHRAIIALGR